MLKKIEKTIFFSIFKIFKKIIFTLSKGEVPMEKDTIILHVCNMTCLNLC